MKHHLGLTCDLLKL